MDDNDDDDDADDMMLMALWGRSGRGDPKVTPNHAFGAICGSLGPIRARRPENDSKPFIWSHLLLTGPDPGQEARKRFQTLQLEPPVAHWARSGPGDPKVAPQNVLGLICGSRA